MKTFLIVTVGRGWGGGRVATGTSGVEAGRLLNTPQCPGRPTTENEPPHMSAAPRLRSLGRGLSLLRSPGLGCFPGNLADRRQPRARNQPGATLSH